MPQAQPQKMPRNLSGWLDRLARPELPVDPGIKTAALHKLGSKTANANNVASIVAADPALSLVLYWQANKSLVRSGNEANTLPHVISLLGFPRVKSIIHRAVEYDPGRFPQLAEYRQQLTLSLHAAHQASGWSQHNPYWNQSPLFWPALLHRAPIWALWYHAGDTMQQLQLHRARHHGAGHSQQQEQLLGISLNTLCVNLSRLWCLPGPSRQGWHTEQQHNLRQWIMLGRIIPELSHIALADHPGLQRLANNPAFAIALANRLADEADWSWDSNRLLRLQRILATALNLRLPDSIAISHQQAAIASQQCRIAGSIQPAAQLLGHYNKSLLFPTTSPKPVNTKPDFPAAETTSRFARNLQRLQRLPQSFNNLHEIMQLAVTSCCLDLKLDRASAIVYSAQNNELRTYTSSGTKNSPALRDFRHRVQAGDLFHTMLKKPVSLRLMHSNYGQIWPLLPRHFQKACATDEFFIMTLFADQQPKAMIYADRGIDKRPLNNQQYTLFKQLGDATNRCLQLRQRHRS